MGVFQIILLVLGVAIFVVSFFLPGGNDRNSEDIKKEEKRIREKIDEEFKLRLSTLSSQVEEIVDEKSEDAIAKTERGLERVTNDKIMSVSEYGQTVLDDIKKSHDEVVFLYSMVNEKQEEIKGSIATLNEANKEARQNASKLNEVYEEENTYEDTFPIDTSDYEEAKPTEVDLSDVSELLERFSKEESLKKQDLEEEEQESEGNKKGKKSLIHKKESFEKKKRNGKLPDLSNISGGNSNEMILKLHEEGKSNVAIAKELGLGVGEVKLVIDLFENC
ncbi:MAG: DUF6115 domain-containing protein [Lachnospiraceae bacterium]|nr:DUF6115 domain-containing protein [Lachnospiraceae bacterium]